MSSTSYLEELVYEKLLKIIEDILIEVGQIKENSLEAKKLIYKAKNNIDQAI